MKVRRRTVAGDLAAMNRLNARIARKARREPRVAGCPTCARDPEGRQMMPPHTASDRCESGKHDHCSCDTCF